MQDNFNIHNWRLQQALKELEEKTLCKECGAGYMEEGQCNECGYLEEATFTDKHDDNPELKGGQKDLPDELQAQLIKKEGSEEDHEVFMAKRSLQAIMSACSKLMVVLGDEERNIPGWIQDHIVNAENYIEQAAQGFHELDSDNTADNTEDSDVVTELDRVDDNIKTKAKNALTIHLRSAMADKNQEGIEQVKDAKNRIEDATSVDELANILGEFGFEDDEIQDILG